MNRFIEDNAVGEDCRWVLKAPFTTNHRPYLPLDSVETIISGLKSFSNAFYGVIPYVMLQRYFLNKHEVKVTCINGQALHLNHKNYNGNRKKFPEIADDTFLFALAERAIKELKDAHPEFLCSGITRVDIMHCSILNHFYVNEVESLEAGFDIRSSKYEHALSETKNYLSRYHYDILKHSILKVVDMHTKIILK